jgi:hypothetical protein
MLEFDDSLHFGEVNHDYRIIRELPDKHPCFAAILDWWAELKHKFFRLFVDNTYAGKFIKAFPQSSIGCNAAAKRSAWG